MTETAPPLMRALIGGLGPDWHLEHFAVPDDSTYAQEIAAS
jgi:hypothetical protein